MARQPYPLSTYGWVLQLSEENPNNWIAVAPNGYARLKFDGTNLLFSGSGSAWQIIATSTPGANAFLEGGNAFGVKAVLGTLDPNDLGIITNGTEKMIVLQTGEVLVGYNAPVAGETFGVLGNVNIEGSETLTDGVDTLTIDKSSMTASSGLNIAATGAIDLTTVGSGSFKTGTDLNLDPLGELQINGAPGGAGDVLTSNGAGVPPTWQALPPGPVNPFIQDGNSFAATAVLGTNDNFDLTFETNNVTHATLTTGGEFLVGYSAPAGTETLGVLGDARVEGSEVITDGVDTLTLDKNSATASNALTLSSTGNLDLSTPASTTITTGGSTTLSATTNLNLNPTGELQVNGATGGAGDVLTSNGAGVPPTWQALPPAPVNPFVQGGNSFAATAVLGTNDNFNLEFETNAVTRTTLTNAGEFLVGYGAPVGTETLGTSGTLYVGLRALVGASSFSGSENLKVQGGALLDDGGAKTAFLGLGKGTNAGVSGPQEGHFRYNETSNTGQLSVGAGPFYDLITSNTISTTAFVQGGNTFGSLANLGTNDGNDLAFKTNNTEKARLLTGGQFVVGNTASINDASLRVFRSKAGTASTTYATVIQQTVTGTDTGFIGGENIVTTAYADAPDTQGSGAALNVQMNPDGSGTKSIMTGAQVLAQVQSTALGAAGAVTTLYGQSSTVGYSFASTPTSGAVTNAFHYRMFGLPNSSALRTITNNYGLRVDNQGSTGITNSYGIDVVAQSGSATTNIGIRSQSTSGAGVFGAGSLSGTEAVRVSGNGLLVDGTQLTGSVTTTLALNNSGGPINIGNNADAFSMNLGTGAAARTVTIGNQTGASSVKVDAGTGNIDIGVGAQARSINVGTGAAAQTVSVGSTNGASSMTIDAGTGTINVGTSASARTTNIATGAAAQTVNVGSTNTTSTTTLQSGTGYINATNRFYVKNASGLYVLDGGGTNGLNLNQQSGTIHQWSGQGTTTTMRSNVVLDMNNNITSTADGSYNIGTESLRFAQITEKTVATKTHAAFAGSLSYQETGALQTSTNGFTTIYTLALVDNSGYWIEVFFVGRDTGSGNRGMFRRQICGYRQGGGAANVGGNATIGTDYNPGGWGGVQLTTSGNNIVAQVNGAVATTINWVCTVRWQYVSSNV